MYPSRTGVNRADVAILGTKTGRVDVVEIAAAPGTTAGCLHLGADGRRLYVANHAPSGGALAVVGTRARRVVDIIEVGSCIRDVALSPHGRTAYVACWDPGFGAAMKMIDTRAGTVTGTVKLGGFLTRLAPSDDGDRAYLVGGDGVTVLSTRTFEFVGTFTAEAPPFCVFESPDCTRPYVADCHGVVTVVSIATIRPYTARAVADEGHDRA